MTPENDNPVIGDLQRKLANARTTSISFFLLFILAAGMLLYYQFYRGNGQWGFSLKHPSSDTSRVAVPADYYAVKREADSFRNLPVTPIAIRDVDQPEAPSPLPQEVHIPDFVFAVTAEIPSRTQTIRKGKKTVVKKIAPATTVSLAKFESADDAASLRQGLESLGIKNIRVTKQPFKP